MPGERRGFHAPRTGNHGQERQMTETMRLSDGRALTYDIFGDPEGTPVIFSHGFSDSHLIRHPDDSLTASLGVRWIAADQPGVGGSTPMKGRKMVDWGPDMEQLADHLGLEAFNVAGHSGAALMRCRSPTICLIESRKSCSPPLSPRST